MVDTTITLMVRNFILGIVLLLQLNAFAGYVIKSISIEDDLVSNRIEALEIDSLNTLWIGSNLGLHSYNNNNVATHKFFVGKKIESICQLRKGEVVVHSNSSVYAYSYVCNKIKRIGDESIRFTSMFFYEHTLYLSDEANRIYCYNGSLEKLIDIAEVIPDLPANALLASMYINSEGKMVVALNNYGVVTLNARDFRIESVYKTPVWKYKKIVEYNQRVFIASYSGVLVFLPNGKFVRVFNKATGSLPGNIVMDLCVNDQRKEVWIVLDNFGIYALNSRLETFCMSNLSDYKDFRNKSITSIRIDENNNIYAGTVYEGVIIAVNSPFNEIISETSNNIFKPLVLASLKDSENIVWCGSDNVGLFSVDSLGQITSYYSEQFRVINFVASYSDNKLLVAEYNDGICLFDKQTGTYTKLSEINKLKKIKARENSKIFEDRNKNIWIFSDSLYCIDASRESVQTIRSFAKGTSILPDRFSEDALGRIWFLSESYLLCYNGSTSTYDYIKKIDMPRDHMAPICAEKTGEVIIASRNTLYRFDTNSNTITTFDFPLRDRRAVNIFYHKNNDRYIFMTTKDIITASITDSLSDVSIVNASSFDSRMYFDNSSFERDGEIYAGYGGGICSFNIQDLFNARSNQDIQLMNLSVYNTRDDGKCDTSIVLFNQQDEIRIRRPTSHYRFTFQGENIANLNHVQYKYLLEGVDKDWILTSRGEADYRRLKPGSYVFRVKSVDNRGLEGKEIGVQMKILAPLLRSKFLVLAYVLIALFIVGFWGHYYYSRVLKSKVVVDWNIEGDAKYVVPKDVGEDFIHRFKTVIEKNISNCDLHVDELARELNVSRTVLYEKVNKVSGYSVKSFINMVRLEKAKKMLEDPAINISDISYECGFNSASYFSAVFKRSFNMSPSAYRNRYLESHAG